MKSIQFFFYNIYYNVYIYLPRQLLLYYNITVRRNKYHFDRIKKYENIHRGKRIFIVATGPSLRIEDLYLIKNEISIGVNSIVLAYDKTSWRPTYFGLQDKNAYERLEKYIIKYRKDIKDFFCGISINTLSPKVNCACTYFALNLLDHDRKGLKHIIKSNKQASKYLFDGHSITFSMIELAMYMGANEIVLLGVDCDYSGSVTHFQEYTKSKVENASYYMYQSFINIKKFAEKHNIKIINASRGGKLDVFERIDLEGYLCQDIIL